MKIRLFLLTFSFILPNIARTQNLSLSALLDLKNMTNVASGSLSMSPEESPGIVSIITKADIQRLGAQDITDVLRTVPGFDFGSDTQELEGLGVRGLWGSEGKVLLLIDGVEMNEQQYATLQFGSHYPLSAIQRIEIIRGPGSALYGGFAEFAVINIVTRDPNTSDGIRVDMAQGLSTGREKWNDPLWTQQNYSLIFKKTWNDFVFDLNGLMGINKRSDGIYTDIAEGAYNQGDKDQWIKPSSINGAITWQDLQLYGFYDSYNVKNQSNYTYVLPISVHSNFYTEAIGLKANRELMEDFHFIPQIEYRKQIPYQVLPNAIDSIASPWTVENQDAFVDLHFGWRILDNLYIDFGNKNTWAKIEALNDSAQYGPRVPLITLDSNNIFMQSYWDYAIYAQLIWQSWANITLGARDEYNAYIHKNSFVPRFAITKAWDQVYVKLLASEAFRAPAFENVISNESAREYQQENQLPIEAKISPEQTTVFEIETGYRLNHEWSASINLFDINIQDPIVFATSTEILDNYYNVNHWGSLGLESSLKYESTHWSANFSYSYYHALLSDSVIHSQYGVPGQGGSSLAFPNHKITAGIAYRESHWLLATNEIFNSSKYGVNAMDSINADSSKLNIGRFSPTLIWNAHGRWNPDWAKGGFADLGCQNILNQNYVLAQAYTGGRTPLPTNSRTFFINLGWQLGLD